MRFTFIPNNSLNVYPKDEETKFIFEPYLRSAPYDAVRPDQLFVSIALAVGALEGITIEPDRVYSAFITGAEIWWDSYSDIKDLIITLESEELNIRHFEALARSNALSVYPEYKPHITLAFDIPNSNSRNRWWTNQIIQDFNTTHKGKLIRLSGEQLNSTSGIIEQLQDGSVVIDQPTL